MFSEVTSHYYKSQRVIVGENKKQKKIVSD